MTRRFDFGYAAIIIMLIGIYLLIADGYVYKNEKYYLGEKLSTKNIAVKKIPEFIGGNIFRSAHYNFTGTAFKSRLRISDGALEEILKNNTTGQIASIKKNDSLVIKIRSADESNLSDSTSKIRVVDLIQNNNHLINSAEVEKCDRKNYNLKIGAGIIFLLIGIVWQFRRINKKKNHAALSL